MQRLKQPARRCNQRNGQRRYNPLAGGKPSGEKISAQRGCKPLEFQPIGLLLVGCSAPDRCADCTVGLVVSAKSVAPQNRPQNRPPKLNSSITDRGKGEFPGNFCVTNLVGQLEAPMQRAFPLDADFVVRRHVAVNRATEPSIPPSSVDFATAEVKFVHPS